MLDLLLVTGKNYLLKVNSLPYESVSFIYKELMKDVNYKDWGKYILDLTQDHLDSKKLKVLELGSGNCNLAEIISRKYKDFIASDISLPMLKQGDSVKVDKICCDMTALPFNEKFDLVFSAFDSVNYLLNKRKLLNLFMEVKKVLKETGIFTFDVSLEKNSLDFENAYTIEGQIDGFHFTRRSKYYPGIGIHKNKFKVVDANGNIKHEIHKQKIYKFETYFDLIDKAGLYVVECLEAFTFNNGNRNCERIQFILKIDKNKC